MANIFAILTAVALAAGAFFAAKNHTAYEEAIQDRKDAKKQLDSDQEEHAELVDKRDRTIEETGDLNTETASRKEEESTLQSGNDSIQQDIDSKRKTTESNATSIEKLENDLAELGQVEDLAADIDRSPVGLVDDYPEQCFPADVGVAIAMIRHADSALGTDRSAWARRAMRRMLANFGGELPPYMADDDSGRATAPSRGCTNGFFFSLVRECDPAGIDGLYRKYVDAFWQLGGGCAGWREFPADPAVAPEAEWHLDPDSGPVIAGFGTSATGLGLGAARRHGDSERAGMLGAELIATALPLPSGRLLVPSLVADFEHAPLFPEIVMLHQLSIADPGAPAARGPVPPVVWVVLGSELLVGLLSLRVALRLLRGRRRTRDAPAPA